LTWERGSEFLAKLIATLGLDECAQLGCVEGVPDVPTPGAGLEALTTDQPHRASQRQELDAAWKELLRASIFRAICDDAPIDQLA
jgi:hypothetical protein